MFGAKTALTLESLPFIVLAFGWGRPHVNAASVSERR
jgi:hypothetical protein